MQVYANDALTVILAAGRLRTETFIEPVFLDVWQSLGAPNAVCVEQACHPPEERFWRSVQRPNTFYCMPIADGKVVSARGAYLDRDSAWMLVGHALPERVGSDLDVIA